MDADDFDDDELLLLKLEEEEHIVIAAATAVMDAGRAVMDYAQTHYDKTPHKVQGPSRSSCQANPKFVNSLFLMHSESLLTLDQRTLFYFNLRQDLSGPNLARERFADVKSWIAGVEPPSRSASRASETLSAASKQDPDVHMGGVSDDEEAYGTEREYHAIMNPPKGNTRMARSVLFFQSYIILLSYNSFTCLSEKGKNSRDNGETESEGYK